MNEQETYYFEETQLSKDQIIEKQANGLLVFVQMSPLHLNWCGGFAVLVIAFNI